MLELQTKASVEVLNMQKSWLAGVGFTFAIAAVGVLAAKLPGLGQIGPMACAILIAVLYRQVKGYPEALRPGIQFVSKRVLRAAIILFGLKLNIDVILHQGLGLLLWDVGTVVLAIGLTLLLAKWMKADLSISLLLGIGTGVCGAAAIAAVSPILKSKEEETAIAVGGIAFVGTLFAIGYTLVRPYLPLDSLQYGAWSGASLHEIAHVALAGAPAGQDALAMALLAKLGRVFLLVPLSILLLLWKKGIGKIEAGTRIDYPWFLLGFLVTSLFGSYVLGRHIVLPSEVLDGISRLTSFLLSMAMVGLGLNVCLRNLRDKALRPLAAMLITSIVLSAVTYLVF